VQSSDLLKPCLPKKKKNQSRVYQKKKNFQSHAY
jgi:hypothetical protein